MPHFTSYDGAQLAYRVLGHRDPGPGGAPVVCLAGGPARDAAYLGGLGGLDARVPLVVPDARGTGASPTAADPAGYAFPRLAEDVEALRAHLGLDRFALLAHDAAAATAQAYAAAHPERLSSLVLLNPGSRLQGRLPHDAREIFESRAADEDWWEDAYVAVQLLQHADDLDEIRDLLLRAAPMAYARWEGPQQEHALAEGEQLNPVPRAAFWQGVDEAAGDAIVAGLAAVEAPVLVVTGALDAITGVRGGEYVAECFPEARVVRLPEVGHYPWVDAPQTFVPLVADFLRGTSEGA
ncbi:alpha/beta hydrolase [Streptomyces sp. HNM0574]|uniref:alpha/beta fold hydrolase n=1 Tax=Streptomyces sp. HNM0574 TaxID=2714954 RepID=UPI00146EE578|nr:alpha/beta hydrolase [Streptomyces sp. HNM0574]NLU66574.1 alpha/beta hydrolase [Streptomyces sp. HNM0574]